MTFSGFKSRWMTPREWAKATASATFIRMSMFSAARLLVDDLTSRASLDALHRVEERPGSFAPQVVDRNDVRMIEIAGHHGFGKELLALIRVGAMSGLSILMATVRSMAACRAA